MNDTESHNRFIELRSRGLSFAKIAGEMNISKPTLIKWSRKFQFEIQNLRAIELEALQEQWLDSRETRIRKIGEQLQKAEAELATRDLVSMSTGRLYSIVESLRRQVQHEAGELRFSSPTSDIPPDEFIDEVQDWKP